MRLIIVCALLLLPWVADAANNITIGPAELLYSDAQMPLTMDGSFATLRRDATTVYVWHTFGTETAKYFGPLNAPLQMQVWLKGQSQLWNMNGFDGTPWLYNVYEVSPGGPLLGFIHRENGLGPPFEIGMGYSTDGGDNWTYLGDILKPQCDQQNPGGVPYLVVGSYFYVYFNEWPLPCGTQKRMGVVRALVADVVAAAANGQVVPWKKHSNGAWTEDGFTGVASNIIADEASDEAYDFHADAAYSTALGKYIITLDHYTLGQLLLYTSLDGVTWSERTVVDQAPDPTYTQPYSSIVGLSGGVANDMHIVDSDFYIIYPRKNQRVDYNYDELYRRRITIDAPLPPTPDVPTGVTLPEPQSVKL